MLASVSLTAVHKVLSARFMPWRGMVPPHGLKWMVKNKGKHRHFPERASDLLPVPKRQEFQQAIAYLIVTMASV